MKKRPVGRPVTTGTTPLSTFRLKSDTLTDLNDLVEYLGANKTAIVTLAIRRMARTELPAKPKPRKKGRGK